MFIYIKNWGRGLLYWQARDNQASAHREDRDSEITFSAALLCVPVLRQSLYIWSVIWHAIFHCSKFWKKIIEKKSHGDCKNPLLSFDWENVYRLQSASPPIRRSTNPPIRRPLSWKRWSRKSKSTDGYRNWKPNILNYLLICWHINIAYC